MRTYRSILKSKLRDAGITQKQIATHMGWASQGTVSFKLNGARDWSEGELQKMATLAGVTVAWLAENSDDLVITKNKQSATIASKADSLTDEQRALVLSLIDSMSKS